MVLISYSYVLLIVEILFFFLIPSNGCGIVMLKGQNSHCCFILVAGFVLLNGILISLGLEGILYVVIFIKEEEELMGNFKFL